MENNLGKKDKELINITSVLISVGRYSEAREKFYKLSIEDQKYMRDTMKNILDKNFVKKFNKYVG